MMERHRIESIGDGAHCITLLRDEIKYDAEIASYFLAKIHFGQLPDKDKAEVMVTDDVDDWLDREVQSAIASVKHEIRFAVNDRARMATDEILEHPRSWNIILKFGENWTGLADTLCDKIHDYVAKSVLSGWFKMVAPNMVSGVETDKDQLRLDIVSEARHSRVEPPMYRY